MITFLMFLCYGTFVVFISVFRKNQFWEKDTSLILFNRIIA